MADPFVPSPEWLQAANRLATIAHQLSSVAHEANNLLQVIAGSAEMIGLQAGGSDATQRRAATIADHAHRVSALLGAVQDLARVPERDVRDSVPMKGVIASAMDLRRHGLTRARIATEVTLPDDPCHALASWGGVMQILLNVLTNAEQSLHGRSDGRIRVDLARVADDIVVRVEDNGTGFEPGALQAGQLGRSPNGLPKLGLGLAIAELVAGREGGRLDLSSGAAGTTVTLVLRAV